MKLTSTYCAKTSLFGTYFQPIHEECHLFHEMRTNLLKHFELVSCGSFRRTRVLTVQSLGCNWSWFWLEFYLWSDVLLSWNLNLHLHNKIKWICILLGFLKSGFIPHLPYQTHCPPVEALTLKKILSTCSLTLRTWRSLTLGESRRGGRGRTPWAPSCPPSPLRKILFTWHTQISQIWGETLTNPCYPKSTQS